MLIKKIDQGTEGNSSEVFKEHIPRFLKKVNVGHIELGEGRLILRQVTAW